jgi:hypothetical protein
LVLHSAGRITVDAREKEWTADIMPCAGKKGKSRVATGQNGNRANAAPHWGRITHAPHASAELSRREIAPHF